MKHIVTRMNSILFACQQDPKNPRYIKLQQAINPQVADILVYENGDIYTIHDATPRSPDSNAFFMYEEKTGTKSLFIKTRGVTSSISFYHIYRMAFEENEMPEKALKQKVCYENMCAILNQFKGKKGDSGIRYRSNANKAW